MPFIASSVYCFNTQPPEGGWNTLNIKVIPPTGFNTQPPEGGWTWYAGGKRTRNFVSTHSRPKAAGTC